MRLTFQTVNRLVLAVVLIAQTITHLTVLSISGQVGQFAVPYLMSRGIPLYSMVVESRPPATALLITLLMRLFPGISQVLLVRGLNLALILTLTLVIYVLARRLYPHPFTGSAAVLVWFLWEPTYANILAYFDIWVGLCLVLTVLAWVIYDASQYSWLAPFVCGLVLGIATLFKQPAWAGVILFGLWLLVGAGAHHPRRVSLPSYLIGLLIPTGGALLVAGLSGQGQDYWFWTFRRYFTGVGVPKGEPFTGAFFRKLAVTNGLVPVFGLSAIQRAEWKWGLVLILWFAGGAGLFPNFGEIYVMGHLPLMCVMSGIALVLIAESLNLASIRRPFTWLRERDSGRAGVVGLLLGLAVSWSWTAAAIYAPHPMGRGKVPAYDEFVPLAQRLAPEISPDETLYMLPMSDGNAQLYVLLNGLPPQTWSVSHNEFLDVAGFTDRILQEWKAAPPNWIIAFPELVQQFEPGITPLMDFLDEHYTLLDTIPSIPFNGDALIYRLKAVPEIVTRERMSSDVE